MALPPHPDPGRPDARGPARYLWWTVRQQPGRTLRGTVLSCLWLAGTALEPFFIRGAIDNGLIAGDGRALLVWTGAMAGVALTAATIGLFRHRAMSLMRADAAYRTVQVVTRQVARLGAVLPRRVATGEVVTVGTTDIWHLSQTLTMLGPGVGGVVAVGVVAVLVFGISPLLGVLIMVGVPAVTIAVGPLLGRLQRTESEYRRQQGALTAQAGDIVSGLRVLRGIGGESMFADRYRRASQGLQAEGYRVGAVTSWVRALAAGLPALFIALVTWLAARLVAQGEISIGDLVAVFAYATVLVLPVIFIVGSVHQLVRGLVAARRVVHLLRIRPAVADGGDPAGQLPAPVAPADLHDPASGLTVPAGALLAVAGDEPGAVQALADRLGRYVESAARFGGVPLSRLPLTEVRARILVAEGEAYLFAGTLQDLLRPVQDLPEGELAALIERCLHAAAVTEVVAELPDGLGAVLPGQARTFSGGQRQRLRLARALLADPEVLILLEPTSAVDAHTEAAIADRLRAVRAGRTTVVTTTSPLLLDRADQVAYLAGDQVVAAGSHATLLATCPGYRSLVTRASGDDPVPVAANAADGSPLI